MKTRLIVLIPLVVFFAWVFIMEPKGGSLVLGFAICFFCTLGLAQMSGIKEVDLKGENKEK